MAVVRTAGVLEGADALLTRASSPLLKALPVLIRLVDSLSPQEIDAAVLPIDRLNDVGPDIHSLLEIVEDLQPAITGLPGIGRFTSSKDDD